MGLWQAIQYLLGGRKQDEAPGRWNADELARRLGMPLPDLCAVQPDYRTFNIPKRDGGHRQIQAPAPQLRALQRKILRRVLGRLRCHPTATGFERGHSIVTNALPHTGKAVVLRMDLQKFFTSTTTKRVHDYFRAIGWNGEAAGLLTRLCTHQDSLPQGAPTSPRLSNLVNVGMDVRLYNLAGEYGAVYTRYTDDLTFSFTTADHAAVARTITGTRSIVRFYGYKPHLRKKLRIRRRHQRQLVTGLVVNDRVRLPRKRRRWLRAVEHHLAGGQPATLSPQQLAGWHALQHMITQQSAP